MPPAPLPPPSGSPRPLPAPPGAQPAAAAPDTQAPALDTQWLWDVPEPSPVSASRPPAPQLPAAAAPHSPPSAVPLPPGAHPYGTQPPYGFARGPGARPDPGRSPGPGPGDRASTLPGGMPALDPGGRGPRGRGPGRLRLSRPRGPLVPGIAAAALIIVIAGIIVAARGGGAAVSAAGAPATGATPGTRATSSPAQAAARQRQQATRLADLLARNGGDRSRVDNAFYAAESCKSLKADERVFTMEAAKRESLVTALRTLDSSALSPAMTRDLNGGWRASALADADYAQWAASLRGHCKPSATVGNPHYLAADSPDSTATNDKKAFTRLWNPLARKYGLTTYSYAQL